MTDNLFNLKEFFRKNVFSHFDDIKEKLEEKLVNDTCWDKNDIQQFLYESLVVHPKINEYKSTYKNLHTLITDENEQEDFKTDIEQKFKGKMGEFNELIEKHAKLCIKNKFSQYSLNNPKYNNSKLPESEKKPTLKIDPILKGTRSFDQVVRGNVKIIKKNNSNYKITFYKITKFLQYQVWDEAGSERVQYFPRYNDNHPRNTDEAKQYMTTFSDNVEHLDVPTNVDRDVVLKNAKEWVVYFNSIQNFTPTTVMEIGNNKYIFVIKKVKINKNDKIVFYVSTKEIHYPTKMKCMKKIPTNKKYKRVRFDIDYGQSTSGSIDGDAVLWCPNNTYITTIVGPSIGYCMFDCDSGYSHKAGECYTGCDNSGTIGYESTNPESCVGGGCAGCWEVLPCCWKCAYDSLGTCWPWSPCCPNGYIPTSIKYGTNNAGYSCSNGDNIDDCISATNVNNSCPIGKFADYCCPPGTTDQLGDVNSPSNYTSPGCLPPINGLAVIPTLVWGTPFNPPISSTGIIQINGKPTGTQPLVITLPSTLVTSDSGGALIYSLTPLPITPKLWPLSAGAQFVNATTIEIYTAPLSFAIVVQQAPTFNFYGYFYTGATKYLNVEVGVGVLINGYMVGPGADLSNANLTGANLTDVNLIGAILTGANLTNVNFTGVNFTGVNLTGANLTGANLLNTNLTGVILTGVISGNIVGTPLSIPTGYIIQSGYIIGRGVNLTDANLTNAKLTGANLTDANITGANLTGANLTGANLTGANLTDANITNAIITGVNFKSTTLFGLISQNLSFTSSSQNLNLPANWTLENINNTNGNIGYCLLGPGANLSYWPQSLINIGVGTLSPEALILSEVGSLSNLGIDYSSSISTAIFQILNISGLPTIPVAQGGSPANGYYINTLGMTSIPYLQATITNQIPPLSTSNNNDINSTTVVNIYLAALGPPRYVIVPNLSSPIYYQIFNPLPSNVDNLYDSSSGLFTLPNTSSLPNITIIDVYSMIIQSIGGVGGQNDCGVQ